MLSSGAKEVEAGLWEAEEPPVGNPLSLVLKRCCQLAQQRALSCDTMIATAVQGQGGYQGCLPRPTPHPYSRSLLLCFRLAASELAAQSIQAPQI